MSSGLIRRELHCHPGCDAHGLRLDCALDHSGGGRLSVTYLLRGDIDGVLLPPPAAPARTDGLWRHSCFEIFLKGVGDVYWEYNFAPSGQWASYRFARTREGMEAWQEGAAPEVVGFRTASDAYELTATIELPVGLPLTLALAAVIEQKDGALSYWALAHPGECPDFHHPGGFVLPISGDQK